jgi:hypothetical protein
MAQSSVSEIETEGGYLKAGHRWLKTEAKTVAPSIPSRTPHPDHPASRDDPTAPSRRAVLTDVVCTLNGRLAGGKAFAAVGIEQVHIAQFRP